VLDDFATGAVVGVGSWFRNESDAAEVGLLVEDAWQRQGHGRALLEALAASARSAGVAELVAHALAQSRHVHRMLRAIGPTVIDGDGHVCTLRVALVDEVDALTGLAG
jgi:acetyltransferase